MIGLTRLQRGKRGTRMLVSTALGDQLQRYLDLSSEQQKITANNMANIDTPNYRTQGFEFDNAMRSALLKDPHELENTGGDPGMVAQSADVDGLIARPDGNNVSMDRESMQMAEAQLKFRTGVELIKREYTRILDAIHSDTK